MSDVRHKTHREPKAFAMATWYIDLKICSTVMLKTEHKTQIYVLLHSKCSHSSMSGANIATNARVKPMSVGYILHVIHMFVT